MRAKVANAAAIIAPVWPLKTFIACNPLQGLESLPFEQALSEGTGFFRQTDATPGLESVNRQLIKWCHAFLDEGQATFPMPDRQLGFYSSWKRLAPLDDQLHRFSKERADWLRALPEAPEDALALCLSQLGVASGEHDLFLKQSLAYLPGWSGYVKWRSDWQQPAASALNPITLVDLLAVRLAITCLLWPDAFEQSRTAEDPATVQETVRETRAKIEQAEAAYQKRLLENLLPQTQPVDAARPRPDAQLVFCIDVRSEPFRRCLEAQGNYETFGFAGFFGLPIRVHDYATGETHDSCPVLLKPRHDIYQQPVAADQPKLIRFQKGKRRLNMLKAFYEQLKYSFATPFALVETLGAGCGLLMLGRTLAPSPSVKIRQALTEAIRPDIHTEPALCGTHSGIDPSQQATYAENALRLMGLTDNFGQFVVFCGHGSTTQNNAYASALDCGACGGNHGGPNAQLLAMILNTPSVRAELARRHIHIPADTLFMAGEHNTTTDEVTLYEPNAAVANQPVLQTLKQALVQARQRNTAGRFRTMSQSTSPGDALKATVRRSNDWAEVRPEWGLARNAAFIVGPRRITRNLDLEGRCFLHSYDWAQDPDHTLLETILTAPMVVAQWINSQYLFSTLDNVAYGSGSKVTHNVAGKIGIMQGNASDLMHGLPLQSVKSDDDTAYHQPQRLLTVVYAPRYKIELLIERQPVLQTLFYNGWVTLVAIEPAENRAYQLARNGNWSAQPD